MCTGEVDWKQIFLCQSSFTGCSCHNRKFSPKKLIEIVIIKILKE